MKVGLFAGTFDPPTLGHQEIIERAALLFPAKLYVAVAKSEGKHVCPISQEERIALLRTLTKSLYHVEIIPLDGLVVDLAVELCVDALVRALRNSSDFEYELQMGAANRQMTGIETLCLLTSPPYSHINSRFIREIASEGRSVEGFVPSIIAPRVLELLSNRN